MDILKRSALAFKRLCSYEYDLIAGSKQRLIQLSLTFHENRFMHLVGLHKLTDIQIQRHRAGKLFRMILEDKLSYEDVKKSCFFPQIEDRMKQILLLEKLLDSNDIMIKYRRSFASATVIQAEYLVVCEIEGVQLHYFIDKNADSGKYEGKSFFAHADNKYIRNQQSFKVLKKVKRNLANNRSEVLLDKLQIKDCI